MNKKYISYSLIFLGITLRLIEYFHDNSFWLDETFVALNVMQQSYYELTQPLLYEHHAPIGFLLIQKFITNVFGYSEYAFRIYPQLASIVSVFLFYKVSKFFLNEKGRFLALFLFSTCVALIHYSAEGKPYAGDVFFSLLLLYFSIKTFKKSINWGNIILFGITGAIAIWCAYSSVFVLAGIGTGIIYKFFKDKTPKQILKYLPAFILWGLSFIGFYSHALLKAINEKLVIDVFGQFYVPTPFSLKSLLWILNMTWLQIKYMPLSYEVLIFLFLGLFLMFKKDRVKFIILFLPYIFCLVASFLQQYPFWQRAILFLISGIIIFISLGFEELYDFIAKKFSKIIYVKALLLLILVFIILVPTIASVYNINHPRLNQDVKPAMKFLSENVKPGDTIYIHKHLMYALKYYGPRYGFIAPKDLEPPLKTWGIQREFKENDSTIILGHSDGADIEKEKYFGEIKNDLEKLKGTKRVWLFLTDLKWRAYDETQFIKTYINKPPIKSFKSEGMEVLLYEL